MTKEIECRCAEYGEEYVAGLGVFMEYKEGKRIRECSYDLSGKLKCYCPICTNCKKHAGITIGRVVIR